MVDVSVDKLTLLMEVGGMRMLKKFMHDSDETHAWLLVSFSSIALICEILKIISSDGERPLFELCVHVPTGFRVKFRRIKSCSTSRIVLHTLIQARVPLTPFKVQ